MFMLSAFGQVLCRLFAWNLSARFKANVSKKEIEHFKKHHSTEDSAVDGGSNKTFSIVIFWRATLMYILPPLALCLTIFEAKDAFAHIRDFTTSYYSDTHWELTSIGKAAYLSNGSISGIVLVLGLCIAFFHRFNPYKSGRIVRWTFAISSIIKLWPVFLRDDFKYDLVNVATKEEETQLIAIGRFQSMLENITTLIPLIVAIPRGATGSSMIALSLFPEAVTPKVLVTYIYPFTTLLTLLGLSSLVQAAGDMIMALSVACYFISDITIFFSFPLVLAGDIKELSSGRLAKLKLIAEIVGHLFLIVWISIKVIPCWQYDVDPYYYYFDESLPAHCLITIGIIPNSTSFVKVFLSFSRNFFLGKLLMVDFIMNTMYTCEPTVAGIEHLKPFKINVEDEGDSDAEV